MSLRKATEWAVSVAARLQRDADALGLGRADAAPSPVGRHDHASATPERTSREEADVAMPASIDLSPRPRVFISHSSKDKVFVRRLASDLEERKLGVWIDERELAVGDSIASGIESGLRDSDYLIAVLSEHSVASRWVKAELNAAMMKQLSEGGTVVLPVLIDDCEIPPLLRDRVYADFRSDYDAGLAALLGVLEQESESAATLSQPEPRGASLSARARIAPAPQPAGTGAEEIIANLELAELRRRISRRLERHEIAAIWYDTLEQSMEEDMVGRTQLDCVVSLLDRAKKRRLLPQLVANVARERPDIAAD